MSNYIMKFLLLNLLIAVYIVNSDESTHEYKEGENVLVWVNKIGPFNNPSETYPYYGSHVPFCTRADELESVKHEDFHYHKFDGLGSLLQGNNLVHSGIPIKFRKNQSRETDCTMILNSKQAKALASAIENKYWYQLYIDDLPVWGMIGEYLPMAKETYNHKMNNLNDVDVQEFPIYADSKQEKDQNKPLKTYPHVFTHKAFSIAYNNEKIIEVNLTSEEPVLIELKKKSKDEKPQSIKMTYSVQWIPADTSFNKRFDRYLDFQFFEHQIHWFALFNSFMLVIFLVGMVSMVLLRALKKDYERIASEEDNDLEYEKVIEETGWKKLHGDVFRRPNYLPIFSAFIGTGYQIYTSILLVILLAISGKLYDTRGTITTAGILTFCITSLIAGYTSSQTFLEYSNKEDTEWKYTMIINGLLFPSIIFIICFILNILSVVYNATNTISLLTFLTMLVLWVISLILLLIGTLIGRSTYKTNDFPCAVNPNFVRPLPLDRPWYMHPVIFCCSVGVLPFGSIFIEMYYIFNSFWNYKFYYVYGFMLLVFVILTIVTVCVTIVSTYLLLNSEDRRWKWFSIFSGGSTSLYVFLYSLFYFMTKTQMNGLFQTSFYFGYMFLFSVSLFFMCGSIGYVGTLIFVKKIYDIKSD